MRTHFDFVIVDASPLLKSDLAVLFSTLADGTLLTLRFGRLPSPADARTMSTLNRIGANVAGVLTVAPAMIKSFGPGLQEAVPALRLPDRHVTSHHTVAPERSRMHPESERASFTSDSKIVK
jgi:hypothetical protein